jgi:hypothetical protein
MDAWIDPGSEIKPNLLVPNLNGETAHIVGELIKCSTASKVEPCVMPMAGQDSIFERAAMERKAHMRTAVVDRENLPSIGKEDNDMAIDLHNQAAGGHHVGNPCRTNVRFP